MKKTFLLGLALIAMFVPGCSDAPGTVKLLNPGNNLLGNLAWKTKSGNENDKIAHGTSNRGVRNRSNKLTEQQVMEVKTHLANDNESHATIALDYGVTRETITAIKLGRSWSWL